ncbi:MAG TPA: cytochrome c oxidase assembly protein [Flavisolibacter sp.]|jgi:cytochrome c oxidase assembly factor CtaG|nr:cytochrome c oxidase assembly protein [Flavisolibacter sp.]
MKQLLSYWRFDLSSVIIFAIAILFIVLTKSFSNKKIIASILVLLIICFFSPLHILSANYLFSAHMTVHVILLLCVGPLLVLSLSPKSKQFHHPFNFLKYHPIVGWLSGIGIMWFWHVPVIFNSAMSSMHHQGLDFIAIIEALSLVVAGVLFSSPIIHPNKQYRIEALSGVVYLFTACIGCSLLGLLITFAPVGTYYHFLSMHDEYGLNKMISRSGITQSADQQAAGLIMWVPCCLIYVTAALYLLIHWFKQKEEAIAYSNKI